MHNSKVDYLKRYEKKRVKKQSCVKKSNISIFDDDVCFESTIINDKEGHVHDDESDEDPLVAEVLDESVTKWQPLSKRSHQDSSLHVHNPHNWEVDLSPPRKNIERSQDSRRKEKMNSKQISNDLSPPRIVRPNSNSTRLLQGSQLEISKIEISKPSNRVKKEFSPQRKTKTVPYSTSKYDSKFEVYDEEVIKDIGRTIEDERFMKWGKGVTQNRIAVEKVQEEEYEMSKPLARYADDEDLEKMLKERQREGDPMLLFYNGGKKSLSSRTVKGKEQYQGDSAPNRYGIHPGYRWDGVNRSNGYEKAWFSQSSNNTALAEKSYKWSVEDM